MGSRRDVCWRPSCDLEKVRALGAKGVSVKVIADSFSMELVEVEQILRRTSKESTCSTETSLSSRAEDDEVVSRLLKDPVELCCPLSHQLMTDPVVAADGFTYERCWVGEAYKRAPGRSPMTGQPIATTALNPHQQTRSAILTFKQETVKEILCVVPRLGGHQAAQLLDRGEVFLRPQVADTSARKQLAALLLLRLKMPGTDIGKVAKEAISLHLNLQDLVPLQQAMSGMKAADVAAWILSLDEEMVRNLHSALLSTDAPCKGVVSKALAQRLAGSLLNPERVQSLWQLLQLCANVPEECGIWMQAAACFLCAQLNRLQVSLRDIPSEMLRKATNFMDDQGSAVAFANSFFKYDLGMSMFEKWPVKSTALIVLELANRQEEPEEKFELLLKGYCIDKSNVLILESLAKQLPKLTLEERHVKQASPQQLIHLAQQLGCIRQGADGARVAVFAAKAFAAMGKARESEDAYLMAFAMDHSSREVAAGLAQAVRSAHQRCEELEARFMEKSGQDRPTRLEGSIKNGVERLDVPRLELGSSMVWDLSKYNFTNFEKDQAQLSETFQLPAGVHAWLELYPQGSANSSHGMASLFLVVDKPAVVKWTWRSGKAEVKTVEHDFSKAALDKDGKPQGWGIHNFMPIFESNRSITLRILRVHLPGSSLHFEGCHTKTE